MGDFNIRADSVNVDQIMKQIRARIREKRGVDYTEQQIQELASVKLERFLDPGSVRSDLLQHFRQGPIANLPNYTFEDSTLFGSHRAPIRWMRKLLRPFLKLLFNPNPLIQALHIQTKVNSELAASAGLSYEVLHNLVVELTRLGIEVRNLKMRVESVSSRLDFDERRSRALETVVQYKPGSRRAADTDEEPAEEATPGDTEKREAEADQAESRSSRRRRRRRGRRGGASGAQGGHEGGPAGPPPGRAGQAGPEERAEPDHASAPDEPGPETAGALAEAETRDSRREAGGSAPGGAHEDAIPAHQDGASAGGTATPGRDPDPDDKTP